MVEPLAHRASLFAGDWLANRESADHAARSADLTQRLAAWIRLKTADVGRYAVVDLGCGTGSNPRYLAPRLPPRQDWLLLDQDTTHLEAAQAQCAGLAGMRSLTPRNQRFENNLDTAVPAGTAVITGSALLDLVTGDWLEKLSARADELGAAVLFTLSYSGDFVFTPMLEDDAWILQAVNAHQRSDKGNGQALGPDAWLRCCECFEARGYRVFSAPSTWVLGWRQRELQVQLLQGWAEAAAEQYPDQKSRIEAWLDQRVRLLGEEGVKTRVCHQDFLALPQDDPKASPRIP